VLSFSSFSLSPLVPKKCSVILIRPSIGNNFSSFLPFFHSFVFFLPFFQSGDVAAFSPRFLPLDREKVETFAGETLDFLFAKNLITTASAPLFTRAHEKGQASLVH